VAGRGQPSWRYGPESLEEEKESVLVSLNVPESRRFRSGLGSVIAVRCKPPAEAGELRA